MDLRGSWLTLMHMKFGSAFQSAPSGISQVTVNWNHLSSCSREYCYQAGKSDKDSESCADFPRCSPFQLIWLGRYPSRTTETREIYSRPRLKKCWSFLLRGEYRLRSLALVLAAYPGKPTRCTRSRKRGSVRRGSKPGRISTPGLNRSAKPFSSQTIASSLSPSDA